MNWEAFRDAANDPANIKQRNRMDLMETIRKKMEEYSNISCRSRLSNKMLRMSKERHCYPKAKWRNLDRLQYAHLTLFIMPQHASTRLQISEIQFSGAIVLPCIKETMIWFS